MNGQIRLVHDFVRPALKLLLRVVLVAAAVFVGWRVGTDVGVLVGIAWDEATANDFVSNALLTIPVFGFVGVLTMLLVALRLTRPR